MSKTMLFNPYTGRPRDPRDIQSDPAGILMLDPDEPILAAAPQPAATAGGARECETCEGVGTIDERLVGYGFSNPATTCPDCDGVGEYVLSHPQPDAAGCTACVTCGQPVDAQPAATAGWRMVPMEPTEAMKRAAVVFANGNAVYRNVAAEALTIEEGIYGETYEAMIAAAPQPPQAHRPASAGDNGSSMTQGEVECTTCGATVVRVAGKYDAQQGEPVAFDALLREAEAIVREKPVWRRYIDGTPLANDVPVWMAVFALEAARGGR